VVEPAKVGRVPEWTKGADCRRLKLPRNLLDGQQTEG